MNPEVLELQIKQWAVSQLIDDGLDMHPDNLKVFMQLRAEWLAYQLTAMFYLPSQTIQDRVIAEYPTTLWDHIKKALRLKYRTTQVRLQQWLVIPEIPQPLERYKSLRIAYQASVTDYLT